MKVKTTKLPDGSIELRSTDFEALQEEKLKLVNKRCFESLRKGSFLKQDYKVKESWGEPRGKWEEVDKDGKLVASGNDNRIEFVVILKKLD